jgi:hypothetical protein
MIDTKRLIEPDFDLKTCFPSFAWNASTQVIVPDRGVVLVDPVYVADVYNDDTELASYLRTEGTFIYDFGGDVSAPIWLNDPYVLIPISMHDASPRQTPPGAEVLCDEIGCDSGTFVLIPLTDALPAPLSAVVNDCIDKRNAVHLQLKPGIWELKFEQFPASQPNMVSLCRNIVLHRK